MAIHFHRITDYWRLQAGRPKKRYFYLHLATFFSIYNKLRLLRQKMGGACLYMPQDAHWLASFRIILNYK